jgi:acyl-CoA thioester hydrolase
MHVCTTRVRYAETDQGGVAYHANYLHWFEVGRTAMLRDFGQPYAAIERDLGVLLTVTETSLVYRKPALYDDVLRIETRVTEVKRVRLRIDTRVLRVSDDEFLCQGHVWLASVTRDGRPVPLPVELGTVLRGQLTEEDGKTGTEAVVR